MQASKQASEQASKKQKYFDIIPHVLRLQ